MEPRTNAKRVPQNGPAIREIRQREGLTVDMLANLVDCSAPHVRNIETENKPAKPELLALIARQLHCSISAIRRSDDEAEVA